PGAGALRALRRRPRAAGRRAGLPAVRRAPPGGVRRLRPHPTEGGAPGRHAGPGRDRGAGRRAGRRGDRREPRRPGARAQGRAALRGEPVDAATAANPAGPGPSTRVVVGTEATLHQVERADVVAFLDFDQELLAPRYRAAEQALGLLARAARVVARSAAVAG